MDNLPRQFTLIGTAIAIGALVLQFGFDDPSSPGSEPPQATPEPSVAAPQEEIAARAPATVPVLVANSTDVGGLAGDTTSRIQTSLGYGTLDAVDSTGPTLVVSEVYYVPAYEIEARDIAAFLGLDPASSRPMTASPPVSDLAGAAVLVVIGSDLAPIDGG